MGEPAIRVEGLGKRYRLAHGAERAAYRTLRESVMNFVSNPFKGKGTVEEFWALQDVSFEVQPGEVVGIIGRNGAGKSTLLKVLSRITRPTTGRVEINGRVGSLLEVGTGFHPELTGRENIYLNGSILGMSHAEIARKFDEIVAFAEVEKFLDTPVKRYSSGMYVRLAFAVAAHLEPEILIVDEVLAVGDASFQKKCLGKMGEVAKGGRTVLFVSHSMQAVTRLCTRGILLDGGSVQCAGNVDQVVNEYLSGGDFGPARRAWTEGRTQPGNHIAKLRSVRVRDNEGRTSRQVDIRRPVGIEMEYEVITSGRDLVPNFHVYNSEGVCIFIVNGWQGRVGRPQATGVYRSTMWIPGNFLAEGTLSVWAALSTLDPVTVHFCEPDAVAFEVVDSLAGDAARGPYAGPFPGVIRPVFTWDDERLGGPGAAPEGAR